MSKGNNTLRFHDGAVQFRQRVVVSLFTHRPLLLRNIRSNDLQNPGLRDHEASFLRLIDTMTNGCKIEINSTGTQLRFHPGILLGGEFEHACPDSRSIGWFLEGILPLAPFGKENIEITFRGITDGLCDIDPSPDYLSRSTAQIFNAFGIGVDDDEDDKPQIRITQRAVAPPLFVSDDEGSNTTKTKNFTGEVVFTCPLVKQSLRSIDWTDPGRIKRIRGNAISCKIISSSMAARVAYAAKGVFHRLLPDVWIHTDVHTPKRNRCGPNPGVTMIVSSESTTGVTLTAECCMNNRYRNSHSHVQQEQLGNQQFSNDDTSNVIVGQQRQELPEDLGKRGAYMLLEEIRKGGCIDTHCQSLAFLWMALTPEDVSRIRVGTLSQYSIETLRLIKQALGVEFKVTPDVETKTVLLSCLGTGYRNMAKAST